MYPASGVQTKISLNVPHWGTMYPASGVLLRWPRFESAVPVREEDGLTKISDPKLVALFVRQADLSSL